MQDPKAGPRKRGVWRVVSSRFPLLFPLVVILIWTHGKRLWHWPELLGGPDAATAKAWDTAALCDQAADRVPPLPGLRSQYRVLSRAIEMRLWLVQCAREEGRAPRPFDFNQLLIDLGAQSHPTKVFLGSPPASLDELVDRADAFARRALRK